MTQMDSRFGIEKGHLVKRKNDGAFGVVTAVGYRQQKVMVFWGDGLESEESLDVLEPVPFTPDAAIFASFVEMVNARDVVRGRKTVYPGI